jgi:geranylgeranyl reductase family protein
MSPTKKVLVIGCGPAGSAAAITARKHDVEVTIVDKAVFPRDKCCGDGLTTSALRLLQQLDVRPSSMPSWREIDSAQLRAPDGRNITMPFPEGIGLFAAVVPRTELDIAMRDRAIAEGAKVIEGLSITGVDQSQAGVVATLSDGSQLNADYLIAADGMWSPTRKIVCGESASPYLGEWHAFRQYLDAVSGPARDQLFVWFEPDLLPGYVWSFPVGDGKVNFGYGILRGGKIAVGDMGAIWADLFQRPHISSALGSGYMPLERRTAWPIPAMIDKVELTKGRVLFVGDAACATDPMTGEGIGQAILTGMLAAEAVAEHVDAASSYAKSVRAELVADHKMSVFLGRILGRVRGTNLALRIVDLNSWTRRNFLRWMFEDEPRAIVLTPRRWHRNFLKRPGVHLGK